MYEEFIRERITALRMKKNISEYKMSRDLGHSNSYMHSISSGKSLPSLTEFLYICEYLDITPQEFFNEEIDEPLLVKKLYNAAKSMSEADLHVADRSQSIERKMSQTRIERHGIIAVPLLIAL